MFDQSRFEAACEAVAVHRAALTDDESASLDVVLRGQVARDPSFGHDPVAVREYAGQEIAVIRQLLNSGSHAEGEMAALLSKPETKADELQAASELRRITRWGDDK